MLLTSRTLERLNCLVISALCKSVDGWTRSSASDTLFPRSPRCQASPTAQGSLMMTAPDLCHINISISTAQNKPPLFTTCFRSKSIHSAHCRGSRCTRLWVVRDSSASTCLNQWKAEPRVAGDGSTCSARTQPSFITSEDSKSCFKKNYNCICLHRK